MESDRNPNPPFALVYPILFFVVPLAACLWILHGTHGHHWDGHHEAPHVGSTPAADRDGGQ